VTSVLLVRLSAMGDVVQSLGAAQALRDARPEWRIVWVVQAPFAPLLAGHPAIDRVVAFDRRGGLRAAWQARAELRRERLDVALDLQGNWKSALLARLSGAREVVGMAAAWRQEPASRALLRRTVAAAGVPHPARAAWELVRVLAPEARPQLPRLSPTVDELARERRALAELGVAVERPFDLVVVTDPADARALRPTTIAALLADAPRPVVQVFGPAEAGVVAVAGGAVLRHGRGEVRRLVALGALVAAAGGTVHGPDQGASHVLAAAGARCVVAFGAQDPRRTAPPAAHAVVHPTPPPCAPCRSTTCRHADGPVCMDFDPRNGRAVDVGGAAE
jgi:heptosyltransferase-1